MLEKSTNKLLKQVFRNDLKSTSGSIKIVNAKMTITSAKGNTGVSAAFYHLTIHITITV